jgi:hypothetical protein
LKGSVISQELIRAILKRYALPWEGTPGVPHWGGVLENGRRLSETTGARRDIVELFAVFHVSRRYWGSDQINGLKLLRNRAEILSKSSLRSMFLARKRPA